MKVVNFLDKVEQFFKLGGGFRPLKSDKYTDIVSRYIV
jgi:hypothetical protein